MYKLSLITAPPVYPNLYVEAHETIYRGTVTLGRFINHAPHRACVNIELRVNCIAVPQEELALAIVFRATRRIEVSSFLDHFSTRIDEI